MRDENDGRVVAVVVNDDSAAAALVNVVAHEDVDVPVEHAGPRLTVLERHLVGEFVRHLDLASVERDVEAQAAGGGVAVEVAVVLVAH
eukprot:3270024-Prymnesium_polylepis.1